MKALARSFYYAGRGFIYCLNYERNMRIHLAFTVYMYCFLLFFDFFTLDRRDLALLFTINALVMMAELINTAIENTIDLVEIKVNRLAQIAKDSAAAGVLVGAVFAVLVGGALLWQPEAFKKMARYYIDRPLMFALFILSLIISLIYIFVGPLKIRAMITGKPVPEKGKNKNIDKGAGQ